MISIDIHTKRVSEKTRIFVTRPGARYRFFSTFLDANFVGPDLPGLDLPAFADIADIDDLEQRVRRSAATKTYALRSNNTALPEPSDNLEDYDGSASDRRLAQLIRVVRAYFGELKQGDLVVVPPINFRGLAHIGELTGPPTAVKTLDVPLYPEPLSGRNIRWLTTIEKGKLPAQALDALQKPSPLFLLTKDAWPSIFRRAYGSYVLDSEYGSRFAIAAQNYTTNDDFLIQAFFNFVSSNTNRVAEGSDKLLSFRDGAFAAEGVVPDLYTNVNSPGGLSLKSALITPIVIAVMMSLAIEVGPAAHAAAQNGNITFGNSLAPPNDSCVAEVSKQVVTQLVLLGYDEWAKACEAARTAADKTGISTTVDIKKQ